MPTSIESFAVEISAIAEQAADTVCKIPALLSAPEVDKATKQVTKPASIDLSGVPGAVDAAIKAYDAIRAACKAAGVDPESQQGVFIADIVRKRQRNGNTPTDIANDVKIAVAALAELQKRMDERLKERQRSERVIVPEGGLVSP